MRFQRKHLDCVFLIPLLTIALGGCNEKAKPPQQSPPPSSGAGADSGVHLPTYVGVLTRMGYDRSMIENPIPVEFFSAVGKPSAQWRYSGNWFSLGWYNDYKEEEIRITAPPTGTTPTKPVSFDPGDSRFGFFITMDMGGVKYRWHTELDKNKGVLMGENWVKDEGKSHVKVYPMMVDGREIPNSYLFCWEDYPISLGPSTYIDFTDLIVRVDGVTPVPPTVDTLRD